MHAFFQALANNALLYLLVLLLTSVAVAFLARASIAALYDPWAVQQVQTIFATTAVVFMWMAAIIKSSLLVYHVAAMFAFFYCAGLCYRQAVRTYCSARMVRPKVLCLLRDIFFCLFVVSQVMAWALGGVPLLLESRLNAFSSGGGIGVLSRIISFTSFAALFLTVLRVGISARRRVSSGDVFVLMFTVLASVANGSKTNIILSLLLLLMSNWIFLRVFLGYVPPSVSRKKILAFAVALCGLVLVPVTVEMVQNADADVSGPIAAFGIRLVLSGDGYMWMYGDDYLSTVHVDSPTALLFADFLGVTRIVSWDHLPVHPGLQIYQDLFPNSDSIRGPNLRVDTFGLLYESMTFGVVFAALTGSLFGFLRAWLFKVRRAIFFLPASYLFFQSPMFLVDPLLGVTALVNTGFGMIITGLAVLVLGRDPFGAGVMMRLRNGPSVLVSARSTSL